MKLAAFGACAAIAIPVRLHAGPPSEESLGKLALAEEFAAAGVQAVSRTKGNPPPPMVRESAALLTAACTECDVEPRFPRLLAEARLQLKDVDGAIDALIRYRRIQLPEIQNDQFAQVELIDLVTGKQQSLDDKIKYLKPLLKVNGLPDPVKSHIAYVCSTLLTQKFDTAGAKSLLDQAVQLNPLNPEALQAQFVAAQGTGSAAKEAEALVALLKSNPAQPLVMGTLGDCLASVGLPDAAVTWYKRSFQYSQVLGVGLDPGRYLNYAAALYSMDQAHSADQAAGMLLAGQPANIGAATIALLAARQAVNQPGVEAAPQMLQDAQDKALAALTAQLGTLHGMLHGANAAAATQAATTQPADLIADITADAPTVREIKNRPNITSEQSAFATGYAAALSDLIFYYTYFDQQPQKAEKLLDCLRMLKPEGDAELTRLEGFEFLANGKRDEAKVKFSAVADHDPLSKLGLLLMEPAGPALAADASKLITDHPAGVLGAILLDALRDKGGKPSSTADSTAAAAAADAFPLQLLDLLDPTHTPEFYDLIAQPVHVSVGFDEPALVRVSIKNAGDFDLSVGTAGAIHPDLWFDCATQGGGSPYFAGVAYDRIAGPLVLKAHQVGPGTAQVVRVDAGPLTSFLAERPTVAISLLFSVLTNPIGQQSSAPGQQSSIVPGPGGYRKQFAFPMERRASPISTPAQIQNVIDPALNGRIDQRIHTLELLTDYILFLRRNAAEAQKNISAPAGGATGETPAAGADGSAGAMAPTDGGAGALPPPGSGQAPVIDPKTAQATITFMQGVAGNFAGAIRSALRDPTPIVRYWAQTKVAELSDPGTRRQTALAMIQGKDWEQRMLGLILANDLPRADGVPIAQALTGDSVSYVRDFANATIDVANLAPTTRPAPISVPDSPPTDTPGPAGPG